MKLKRFSVISVWVAVCLIGLIALVFFLDSFETKADREAKAMEQRIRELVPIGMNIDEAIEILRANEIAVTDKYDPIKENDRWYADIKIRYKITPLDTLKTTIHKGEINKYIVSIEATPDGEITKIH